MIEIKLGGAGKTLSWLEWSIQFATITSNLIAVVIWPLVLMSIVYWFRQPLAELLKAIKKFQLGSTSIELTEELAKGEEAAVEVRAHNKTKNLNGNIEEEATQGSADNTNNDILSAEKDTVENVEVPHQYHYSDVLGKEITIDEASDALKKALFNHTSNQGNSARAEYIKLKWREVEEALIDTLKMYWRTLNVREDKIERISSFPPETISIILVGNGVYPVSVHDIVKTMSNVVNQIKSDGISLASPSTTFRFDNLAKTVLSELKYFSEKHIELHKDGK